MHASRAINSQYIHTAPEDADPDRYRLGPSRLSPPAVYENQTDPEPGPDRGYRAGHYSLQQDRVSSHSANDVTDYAKMAVSEDMPDGRVSTSYAVADEARAMEPPYSVGHKAGFYSLERGSNVRQADPTSPNGYAVKVSTDGRALFKRSEQNLAKTQSSPNFLDGSNLGVGYAAMTGNTGEPFGGAKTGGGFPRPANQHRVLERHHSRSCEDLSTMYAKMSRDSSEPEQYENEVFRGAEAAATRLSADATYSYARTDNPDEFFHQKPQTVSSVQGHTSPKRRYLYTKVTPRDKRMSRSMTNLQEMDKASPNKSNHIWAGASKPPVVPHPQPLDFSLLRDNNSGSVAQPQDSSQRSSNPEGVHAAPVVTPPSIQGIKVTEKTRVFTRKKSEGSTSPEKQPPEIKNGSILRKLDSTSMKGRRLPSLPPDTNVKLKGALGSMEGTLC